MTLLRTQPAHDDVESRHRRGKLARTRAPRSDQGIWPPTEVRPDPLAEILAQNADRLPELVPIRHERMAASPWTYLRGAAAVMAQDLALRPHSGLTVQLCGDAHVLNFGLWATPERNLSFDLRDFDETHPGPFEWDVKRLAASLVVLARENDLGDDRGAVAVRGAVDAYQAQMRAYSEMSVMDIWYDHVYVDELLGFLDDADQRRKAMKTITKRGARRTSLGAFDKLTAVDDGRRRIVDDPPLLVHVTPTDGSDPTSVVRDVFRTYRASLDPERRALLDRFSYLDTARKVVGVGSVGMRVHLLLLEGRDAGDPLFLQVKQATTSVLERHTRRSAFRNHGQRVVHGQRLLQSASDIFLGWTRYEDLHFYVRQFRDMKVTPESAAIAPVLVEFATACGRVLARAHARSGDAVAVAAYLGKGDTFAESMVRFSLAYADQTERDHAQLCEAIATGAVEAASTLG